VTFLLRFVLAILATWRITHLLAREDGPFQLLAELRARLGHGFFGGLMDCFNCLSLWVAALAALYVSTAALDWLMSWLALSGAACLLDQLAAPPMSIERISEEVRGDSDDGMLRTQT